MKLNRQGLKKKLLWFTAIVFIAMNAVAMIHAYKFTHFASADVEKTKNPEKLSFAGKLQALVFGVNNPRPKNKNTPTQDYETVMLKSNKEIECWFVKADSAIGTVIIFHGFSGEKSSMIDKSDEFIKQHYNTLLVDFMGSGGSEGDQTTVGFMEAEQVKTAYEYIKDKKEKTIVLFGTSMGAAAIMKAINDYHINPSSIIIECPFGSMYETVCARFRNMNVPSFPMAGLLVFWGGTENGFWAFGHNPSSYASHIKCPALLLYGEKDKSVSRAEINEIYANLAGKKSLKLYPDAGHENYLIQYKEEWGRDVEDFLKMKNDVQ